MSALQPSRSRLLALLAAGALLGTGCAQRPAETDAVQAATAPALPSLDPRTRGWEVGHWYAYDLKLTTAISFGGGARALGFHVEGLVQITATSATPDAVTLYVALGDPKVTSDDPKGAPELDRVRAQLASTGCFFRLAGGRVTDMSAPRGLSATAANTYREIASALQFAHSTSNARKYTAEEYDTTGEYVAEYERDPDGAVWHKRKQRYIAILAAKTAPANLPARIVPRVDASEGDVRLSSEGRPESVDLHDAVTIAGAQQPVRSTTTLSLRARDSQPARQSPPDWDALVAAMQRTAADEPYGAPASIEALDDARIGGMTFDQAVATLERSAREDRRGGLTPVNGAAIDADERARQEKLTSDKSRAFIALSAIFRAHPETIARAVAMIRAKSPASDVLEEALSAASSPPAQDALAKLASSRSTDPEQRSRELMSLSRAPRPDAKAVETLKAALAADPFNEIALLGLGTYSRRLRDAGSVDQANDLGALIVDRLAEAPTTTARLAALRAITNSGYAPALPAVKARLDDPNETIRATAVRALQSMNDPRVDGILSERLRSDPSSDVRVSALAAAKVREPTDALAQAVESAAESATDAHVRYRAVELLAAWVSRRPDVRPTLARIATNDAEIRIRDRAQSAL
jgi:HEAT repeats